jgi:hypothetical protein
VDYQLKALIDRAKAWCEQTIDEQGELHCPVLFAIGVPKGIGLIIDNRTSKTWTEAVREATLRTVKELGCTKYAAVFEGFLLWQNRAEAVFVLLHPADFRFYNRIESVNGKRVLTCWVRENPS